MRSPLLFTEVDALLRDDHFFLREGDFCLFLHEYTSGQGYQHSDANSLISNLKKSPDRKGRPEWQYKERAITRVANELAGAFSTWGQDVLRGGVLVPIPPSKASHDPLFDDRMSRVAQLTASRIPGLIVAEMLVQRVSTPAYHANDGEKRNPATIAASWTVDERALVPNARWIGILDDVLTTGAHYRAAVDRLRAHHLPSTPMLGIFVARRKLVDPFNDEQLKALFR